MSCINKQNSYQISFEGKWKERFEQFAQDFEEDYLVSGWSDQGLQCRLRLFSKLLKKQELPPRARVLDLGCAAGTYVRFLTRLGYTVVGLDYSLPSLSRALTADPSRNGHYVAGNAYHLPFQEKSFDFIITIGVFQALWHPECACDEIRRILRPNGILLIEILNAFEIIALIKRLAGRLFGLQPRVRTYFPFEANTWLNQRNFSTTGCIAIYLPPRRCQVLKRIFDSPKLFRALDRIPGFSQLAAHAFFIIAISNDVKST